MTQTQKHYTQAPLPFQGQKRRWGKEFRQALQAFPQCTTVVDLFGGSGLLSRMAKDAMPHARVIYNDFDGYTRRIAALPRTNALLERIRPVVAPVPENKRLPAGLRDRVLELVRQEEREAGYVDYVTLSASLLFSMKYANNLAELERETLYNSLRQSPYEATGYLDGLEVVHEDYRALFARWRHRPDALFLVDPPYLSTDTHTYTGYWRLRDYLDVLHTLHGTNYVYFTSDKSQLVELCGWLEANHPVANPFRGAVRLERGTNVNYASRYTDIMLYKPLLNTD